MQIVNVEKNKHQAIHQSEVHDRTRNKNTQED